MMFRLSIIPSIASSGLFAFALSTVTHAEIIDVKWDERGQFGRTQLIAPGKFVELCENLPKATTVAWQFNASAPLNFNIHFHQGKDVVFPEKLDDVTEREGTLVAPSKEDYCWMWTNKGGKPVGLHVTLVRKTARH